MRGPGFRIPAALCLGAVWLLAAGVANMSGTWILNSAKSKWDGKKPAPHEVKITIVHDEPKLKYSGWVQQQDGPDNAFVFDGAIDGKSYPIENGTIVFRRLGPNSVESVLKSTHDTYQETAITSISRDGKEMTRRIHAKGPHGTISWTEVYDKLQ